MADVSRRRVTYGQLQQLWEFLNSNKSIATGYNKTSQAREFSKNLWENIAQNLNSHGDGTVKNWKGWCKYWNNYKSKIKKLAAATRASHQQTGGGPSQMKKMTDIEIKFLQILGDGFGAGLPGIRDIQHTNSDLDTPNIETGRVPTVLECEAGSQSILALCPVQIMSPEIVEPGPFTKVTLPPLTPHTTTGAPELQRTPRRSPRRRRYTRREPPLTQDAARRALIRISERRANIEEQNSITLKLLLHEIKEIKEMFRFVVPKHLFNSLNILSLPKFTYLTLQKAAILNTCRTVRKLLQLSSDSDETFHQATQNWFSTWFTPVLD